MGPGGRRRESGEWIGAGGGWGGYRGTLGGWWVGWGVLRGVRLGCRRIGGGGGGGRTTKTDDRCELFESVLRVY